MESKLKTHEELEELSRCFKQNKKQIVTINGAFDLLHVGHLYILNEAKKQGNYLIVGLNSDESIRKYKGENRPIIREKDRITMLSALSCVDYITLFDEEEIAGPLLDLIRPHIHINGSEYGHDCIEALDIRRAGAKLHLVDKYEGFSTSDLIRRIKEI